MTLELAIKVIGWVMAITPVLVYLIVSAIIMWNAGKDDDDVIAIFMVGFVTFGIGVGVLALIYLTDLGTALAQG